MIYITPTAANEIKRLQHSRSLVKSYFRLSVKKGGCSRLYYDMELTETPQDGDRLYQSQEIQILIPAGSEPLLEELKLDYAEDLMGGGFRFHNPQASTTCGCGLSFDINE